MKKFKLIVLSFVFMIILCGCNITANIDIEKNGSLTETVSVSELKNNLEVEDQSYEEYANEMYDFYKDNYDLKKYSADLSVDDLYVNQTVKRKYKNVCDYFKNSKSSFIISNNMKCIEEKDYYLIKGSANYFYVDGDESIDFDEVTLNINIDKSILLDNNADEVEGNVLTWHFNNYSTNDFELKVKRTVSEKIYKSINLNESKKGFKSKILIGILGIIFFAIIILLLKYKKNRVEL